MSYTKMKSSELKFLDKKTIAAIEAVLSKGHRAEVIPVKDGVKVVHVRRDEVKTAEL